MAQNAADPSAESKFSEMSSLELEIQKRLTLNWLIQGAAQHAGMTFQHLVREELDALAPGLVRLYDQFALINLLQYWQPDVALLFGTPTRFWRRALTDKSHPFFGHPLLAKFGALLAYEARDRGLARCKEKGITRVPILFSFQALTVVERLRMKELGHHAQLTDLAKRIASTVWGIPVGRFDAKLVAKVRLPQNYPPPRTRVGAAFRAGLIGLGGVGRRGDELIVEATANNWQTLAKELVKGTAELICLHGLNSLDDPMYSRVLAVTDHIDLEPWMLQSGGELWRRLLLVLPENYPIARVLMRLALLPAAALTSLMTLVIGQHSEAAQKIAGILD
jgi:hypothetical protein